MSNDLVHDKTECMLQAEITNLYYFKPDRRDPPRLGQQVRLPIHGGVYGWNGNRWQQMYVSALTRKWVFPKSDSNTV